MTVPHQPRPAAGVLCKPYGETHHYVTGFISEEVDFAAVERAMNGIRVDLTEADQYEAARRLYGIGYGNYTVAKRVGLHTRTIDAWEAAGWPAERPPDKKPKR